RVIISDLYVLPAALPFKLDDAPQLYPGTDPVYLSILGQPHSRLSARSVDTYLDQIRVSPLHEYVRRNIIDDSAVDIPFAVLHGLILEAEKICACQEEILQPSFRNIRYAQLQLLHI